MNARKCLLLIFVALLLFNHCQRSEAPNQSSPGERFNQLLQTYDEDFRGYLANAQQAMGKEILRYSPISDSARIPQQIEITGSHYEYGTLVGRIAQQHGYQPRRISSNQVDLNNRIIAMYQQIYPPYLDIVQGVADIFNIPMTELDFIFLEGNFFLDLWVDIFKYQVFQTYAGVNSSRETQTTTHCSMISANLDNGAFVGRNFDQDHEKPEFVVVTKMDGSYQVLANACYSIYHWVMDAVNEKGLYMGTANLVDPPEYYWFDPYPDVPAIQEHHLFRIALESCATVDEVIELYKKVRPWSVATDHLMVADALGNSAVIEFNLDRTVSFFKSDNYYQIMTNIAYHEGFDFMMSNCTRFARGTNAAEQGIHSFADVERITRLMTGTNHGYTSFFDLKERTMQLYRRIDYQTLFEFTLPD